MTSPLIKICGLKNTALIADLQALGVHFIGILFHPSSKRYVEIKIAKEIAQIALKHSIIPVGVFVNQTADEIKKICNEVNITYVQLHGEQCKQTHHLLPEHYRRIYVQCIDSIGNITPDTAQGLKYCDPDRDFLMFDYVQPGSGHAFPWEKFHYNGPFKWFLAGGLTPQNVRKAFNTLHPNVVDVSSGVENSRGEKDIELIKAFVKECNFSTQTFPFA